ncbi:MAG: holo-ACP synthase [Pseudonocardiaceae bacterium]
MNLVLRSGVDLVDVHRIAGLVEAGGDTFVSDVWTEGERAYCEGVPERLAGRWGAKEAAMKAIGLGFPDVSFRDIEVTSSVGHQPRLHLHGAAAAAAEALGLSDWSVSLSHEGGLAVAFVIGTGTSTR